MNSILSNSIYRRLLWLKCLIWCQSKHSHTIRFNISVAVACMCELKEGDEKKTNKWTVKSDSIGNWRKLINMERIQTEKEWKGANELSGWSQDNRNYNSSPPKRDSDDYSEKKKHVIIILSRNLVRFYSAIERMEIENQSLVCLSLFSISVPDWFRFRHVSKHTVAMQ